MHSPGLRVAVATAGGRPRTVLVALMALTRIRTCVAGAVLCVAGARVGGGPEGSEAVAFAAASIACLIAFAQVVNDVVDRELDAATKPFRPLPAGAVSPPAAKFLAGACGAAGLALALPVPRLLPFAALLLVLAWAYSLVWKQTVFLGNAVVAGLASCSVSYGAVACGATPPAVFGMQAAVFSFALAFEVLKTAIDADGDAAAGLRTAATRLGVRTTALVAAGLGGIASIVIFLPALMVEQPVPYAVAVGLGTALPTLVAVSILIRHGHTPADLAGPHRLLRAAWGAGVVSLLLL